MERGSERVTNANAVCMNAHTYTRTKSERTQYECNVVLCKSIRRKKKKIDDALSCFFFFLQLCTSIAACRIVKADGVCAGV